MPMLDIQHLTKSFGGVQALNDLDFHVDKGDAVTCACSSVDNVQQF